MLADPLFYISLVLTVFFLCVWLYRLNAALGKYDPLFIIPLIQANYILFSISSGGVYFQEFGGLEAYQWACFICGIAIIFFGLWMLAPKSQSHAGEEDDPALNPDLPGGDSASSRNGGGSVARTGRSDDVAPGACVLRDFDASVAGTDDNGKVVVLSRQRSRGEGAGEGSEVVYASNVEVVSSTPLNGGDSAVEEAARGGLQVRQTA